MSSEKRTYKEDTRISWFVRTVHKGGNDDKEYGVAPYQGDNSTIDPG